MKNDNRSEAEAQRTYDVLDQIGRVEASPWLYTRIRNRLEQRPRQVPAILPAWQWAMVLVAVAASGFFFARNSGSGRDSDQLVAALTEVYDLNSDPYSNFILEPQTVQHGNDLQK